MRLEEFFIKHHLTLTKKKLVVATSGGPDSMALLAKLVTLRKKYHFTLICAHFDHQLRPDSGQEAVVIQPFCQRHQIELFQAKWPKNLQAKTGIEAAARKARYQFLVKVYQENAADYLLTAHHGDDLLENILLKLIRSGNPDEMNSLKAISQFENCFLIRPLLAYSKEELLRFVTQEQIPYVEDRTNFNDDTLRNRLRHQVIPSLKQENSKILANAWRFYQKEQVLHRLAVKNFPQPELFLDLAYRLPSTKLASYSASEKLYFWQNFIAKTWQKKVNDHLAGFNLKEYQNYYYIWPNLLAYQTKSKIIELDKAFSFRKQRFLVSLKELDLPQVGDFWAKPTALKLDTLPSGSVFCLKNMQHVKAKKMFAQARIPLGLRPFCLAIFDEKDTPIFVEQTYQNQVRQKGEKHYYVYQINN